MHTSLTEGWQCGRKAASCQLDMMRVMQGCMHAVLAEPGCHVDCGDAGTALAWSNQACCPAPLANRRSCWCMSSWCMVNQVHVLAAKALLASACLTTLLAAQELALAHACLVEDAKNYHVWAHRQAVVQLAGKSPDSAITPLYPAWLIRRLIHRQPHLPAPFAHVTWQAVTRAAATSNAAWSDFPE